MSVELLTGPRLTRLQQAEFTYDEVGRTAGRFPATFAHLHRTRLLPPRVDFATAARAVMTWQVHSRAGLQVTASSLEVAPDAVVLLEVRLGGVRLPFSAPCRVVYVVDEDDRQGFAYGTLPGHPESGEELFLVERRNGERAALAVSAFSRPASAAARLGGPVSSWIQHRVTTRYLRALDR